MFVSNLDFAVTELEIKDAFSSIGHCEVLLVRDFRGRSKGFGYVLFESSVSIIHFSFNYIILIYYCFVGYDCRSIKKRSRTCK